MPKRGGLEYTPAHPEETQAEYRQYFTDERSFYQLASRPEQETMTELFLAAKEQMAESARAAEAVEGQRSYALQDIQAQLVNGCRQDLRKALAEGDFPAFAAAAEAGEQTSLQFARAVEQNTGFVNLPGYDGPPDFPQGSGKAGADAATAFLEETKAILERIDPERGEMGPDEYRAAQALVSAGEKNDQTARRTDWEDGDPYDLKRDEAEFSLGFRMESLRYLLQPRTEDMKEGVEHAAEQPDDAAKRYEDAGLAVIDGNCNDDDLRTFLHSKKREIGTGDGEDAAWGTITEGLSKDRLDDEELTGFAQALGAYVKDARQELLNEWGLAEEYTYRDDLLLEKMVRIEQDLRALALMEISQRSEWGLKPTGANVDAAKDVARLAQEGRWAEIPGRLREMGQNQEGG